MAGIWETLKIILAFSYNLQYFAYIFIMCIYFSYFIIYAIYILNFTKIAEMKA